MSKHYKTINLISWAVLGVFVIINLIYISTTVVDIPYWDGWEMIFYLPNLSFDMLFTPHNEHLIVTTKLYTYIHYIFNGLNFKYITILNYFFFLGMLLSLYLIIKNYTKDIAYLPLLFIIFFSTIFIKNFMFTFLISLIFMTTFGLLSIYFGFIRERNNTNTIIMLLLMWLSAISTSYSFPTGVMIAYILKELIYISKPENKHRTYEVIRVIVVLLTFILIVIMPFILFHNSEVQTSITPLVKTIISFIKSSLIVSMFIGTNNLFISIPLVIFSAIPIIVFIVNGDVFKNKYLQAFYAILICTAVNIAGVSLIRGLTAHNISPRHYIFTHVATPIIAILFIKLHQRYKNKLTKVMAVIYITILSTATLILLLSGYDRKYLNINQTRETGADCVQAYYAGSGNSLCETVNPATIERYLEKAKQLQLSFTK